MKKPILTFLLVMLVIAGYSQVWNPITTDEPSGFQTALLASSEEAITVNLKTPGFYTIEVGTPRGREWVISLPKAVSTAQAGEPNLPMTAIPVVIGDEQHYGIRVIDAQYRDFTLEVAPSKGDFSRQINPDEVPYTYGEAYSTNAFFPKERVGLYEPYILRDFRGQNMVIYPFAYNPVSKTLRVYYDITVEMYSDGSKGQNTLSRKSNTMKLDPDFKAMYENHFLNYHAAQNRYTPVNENGKLLVICHDAFMSAMEPYVNWKRQIGIPTLMVGTSESGANSEALKIYIQQQYNNDNSISHILLVGDNAQIQGYYAYNGGYSGRSDNWYGQLAGNDFYNDVIVGRFSAESLDHVTSQVNKVLTYERDLDANATWLTYGSGVATQAGNGGHFSEDDWQHIDNIKNDLLNYHYTEIYRDYQNAGGANSSAAQLSQHINNGLSIINYCNHGSETSWGVFNYNNSHINALTNVNKWPIVWSVACLNGKYDHYQPCFAETWLRSTNNNDVNQPTGAIGGMFSYINQPWVPPMYGQDEMVDILVESHDNNIKRTLGGISFDGNMKIIDQYGTNNSSAMGTYMCWILFGDPTLTLRNAVPTDMGVSHAPILSIGSTSFTVNAADGDGARATLTLNNEIIGSALISNGTADIEFEALTQPGQATLTVFGYNKVTYIATLEVIEGGEITPLSVTITAEPSIIARGSSTVLNAQTTGGYGYYTYQWAPPTGLSQTDIMSPTANPTITTVYTCTVNSGTYTETGSITVTVVCPPSTLTATPEENNILLNWNPANPAESYTLYRDSIPIAEGITETSYTDQNLEPGSYTYQVATYYQGILSPMTRPVHVDIDDVCIPPLNFTALYQWEDGTFGTRLIWEKDQSVNMTLNRYHIFRGKDAVTLSEIGYLVNVPYNYHYEYFDGEVLPDHYYYVISAEYNNGSVCYSDTLEVNVTNTIEATDALTLYPNPTTGQVTLHAEQNMEVSVINHLGQQLLRMPVQDRVFTLDLSPYGKGLYLILVRKENKQFIKKIIVE